jgi:hypothetical protein
MLESHEGSRLPQRGDALLLGPGFGVIQSVNRKRGIALVELQNGSVGEIGLRLAGELVDQFRLMNPDD